MEIKKERKVNGIVLQFEDGNKEEIAKGVCGKFEETKDGTCTVKFNFIGCDQKDIEIFIRSVVQMGVQLGVFQKK